MIILRHIQKICGILYLLLVIILIEKLYKLKKNQTDQKLMQKSQFLSKIEQINIEIFLTKNKIDTATVEKFGAISDFMILTIQKIL